MKTRLFPTLSLLLILMAACAPAVAQTNPPEIAASPTMFVKPSATPIVDFTATGVGTDSTNSVLPSPTVQAVATSRGPKLEATDPKTVSMASGGLQFVEFFEFW